MFRGPCGTLYPRDFLGVRPPPSPVFQVFLWVAGHPRPTNTLCYAVTLPGRKSGFRPGSPISGPEALFYNIKLLMGLETVTTKSSISECRSGLRPVWGRFAKKRSRSKLPWPLARAIWSQLFARPLGLGRKLAQNQNRPRARPVVVVGLLIGRRLKNFTGAKC